MKKRLSDFQRAAKQRWPRHYKEHDGVVGDGGFAVLGCTFYHPRARCMCYGQLNLFETRAEAERFTDALNQQTPYPGRIASCHARSEGLCSGQHEIVRLADSNAAKA